MDNPCVGNHLDVLRHPIGARTVELALAPESPRVNCRITPVAHLPGSALSDGAFTGGSNWFKRQLATNGKELKPAQVRGLSEPGFRRHWSVSVTHRFLRRGDFINGERASLIRTVSVSKRALCVRRSGK